MQFSFEALDISSIEFMSMLDVFTSEPRVVKVTYHNANHKDGEPGYKTEAFIVDNKLLQSWIAKGDFDIYIHHNNRIQTLELA